MENKYSVVSSKEDVKLISHYLMNGRVGIIPTDTVYGLICVPDDLQAVEQIYQVKQRPKTMNLPIFVDSIPMAQKLGLQVDDEVKSLFNSPLVPGALTMVVTVLKDKCPSWLSHREEVAIRIPADNLILNLVKLVGPLLCTSANAHGSKVDTRSFSAVMSELSDFSGFVVDGGDLTRINSTIVNCRTTPATIEREGAISPTELAKYIQL